MLQSRAIVPYHMKMLFISMCICSSASTWSMYIFICRYPEFAPMFKAELWDPDKWADLFKEAGAKCELHCSLHA